MARVDTLPGITINFEEGGRSYSATYLPEVASEQVGDGTAVQAVCKPEFRVEMLCCYVYTG